MSDPVLTATALIRSGHPRQALVELTKAVKAAPDKVTLRIFMAQLLCLLGQWERAHTQLNVVAEMMPDAAPMREMVGHALRCELLRAAVFKGKRSPMVFGQPDGWLASLIESLLQSAVSPELSHPLAARAFEAAPASSGMIDGAAFSWIADADSRLGPVLEAMVNGRYYWMPFHRLSKIVMDAPTDLRDRVWIPAQLSFSNGGEAIAMIPVRYVGSEHSEDESLVMGSRTKWSEIGPDRFSGLGQRVLVTDLGEHDLLGVRLIEINSSDTSDG